MPDTQLRESVAESGEQAVGPETALERRLAAILFADVVGYTRLMRDDEAGTFARLASLRRQVIEPLVDSHHGRIVKLVGDGILAEFASVVEAAECALAWQRAVVEDQSSQDPDMRLQFRIGLNVGDVIGHGGDLYGDGVNIAARLETHADPNGILISEDAFRQARGRVATEFKELGALSLKNVAEPVQVYGLVAVSAVTSNCRNRSAPSESPSRPSLAVLPFQNLSRDQDQGFFADGVTEDLISALARNRWLMVIGRSTSFAFKDAPTDLTEIGRQLAVDYVVEGSVRTAGDRVRITAQLSGAGTGNQIWASHYDRVLEDVFKLQDEVTAEIVAAISPELGKAEQVRATSGSFENLDAWGTYHRAMAHLYKRTKTDLREAIRLFEQALSADPGMSSSFSGLVDAYYYEVVLGLARSASFNRDAALSASRRAVDLDPDDAAAHCAAGKARILNRQHALAVPNLQHAIELNPSLAWAHYGLGAAYLFSGHPENAVEYLENAIRISPRDQHMGSFLVRLADAFLLKGDYLAAAEQAEKALQQQGFQWSRYAVYLSALGYLGHRDRAEKVLQECLAQRPDFSVSMVRDGHLYSDGSALEHFLEGMRRAGVSEEPPA